MFLIHSKAKLINKLEIANDFCLILKRHLLCRAIAVKALSNNFNEKCNIIGMTGFPVIMSLMQPPILMGVVLIGKHFCLLQTKPRVRQFIYQTNFSLLKCQNLVAIRYPLSQCAHS